MLLDHVHAPHEQVDVAVFLVVFGLVVVLLGEVCEGERAALKQISKNTKTKTAKKRHSPHGAAAHAAVDLDQARAAARLLELDVEDAELEAQRLFLGFFVFGFVFV